MREKEGEYSFNKKGYPVIELFDGGFQVKGKENLSFRKFSFNEIKKIKFYDPNNNWWTKLVLTISKFNNPSTWFNENYRYLKIYKTNGAKWNYPMPYKIEKDMVELLKLIEVKSNKDLLEIKF